METQVLPSWLSYSTTIITNAGGTPVETSSTLLQLPLTYYGPSIPLGTDGAWTYGGLSSPAPTPTFSSTATTASATSSSTSALPSSSSSSFSSSFSSTSTSTSASTSASTTQYPFSSSTTISKGALIGAILGAIVGSILLLLVLIALIRWRARRRNGGYQTPIWTGWEILEPNIAGDRPPGEGSPRGSGEEVDSFLQRSASATDGTRQNDTSARLVSPPPPLPPGAAPPYRGTSGSGDSNGTDSTIITDYGVLLTGAERIGTAFENDMPSRPSSDMRGHIVAPGELVRLDNERQETERRSHPHSDSRTSSGRSSPEHYSPLLPPPRIDPDRASSRRRSEKSVAPEKEKSVRSVSYPGSEIEDSKILTARRVRVQELGPRSPGDDDSSSHTHADPAPGPSSWRSSLGLSGLARLGRLSWFKNIDTSSPRGSSRSKSSLAGRAQSDHDLEAGRALLGSDLKRGLGLNTEGERPMSSVSTKSAVSGNTIYHDAVSRTGTPITPVSLPPRVLTPAGQRPQGHSAPLPSAAPPAYDDPYETTRYRSSDNYPQGVDVLDVPAPPPAFGASSNNTPLPPGLVPLANPRTWRDSLSASSNDAGITIDVLDAEPPTAGDSWRSLAGNSSGSNGSENDSGSGSGSGSGPNPSQRRTTFGVPQVVHQGEPLMSEQGSLHSMHSHLSPYSGRSSESAPASRRGLSGSTSSRPSAHSQMLSASSGGSLMTGSLSSHGRRAAGGAISPALSAFGRTDIEEGDEADNAQRVSVLGPMPSFALSTNHPPTIRSVGTVGTSTATTTTTGSEETEVSRTTIPGDESDGVTPSSGAGMPWHDGLEREVWDRIRADLL